MLLLSFRCTEMQADGVTSCATDLSASGFSEASTHLTCSQRAAPVYIPTEGKNNLLCAFLQDKINRDTKKKVGKKNNSEMQDTYTTIVDVECRF